MSPQRLRGALWSFILGSALGCGGAGAKNDYILAENLWQQSSYEAAARQFERVFQKDPRNPLGQQALYRAATTQFLYLRNYPEALRLFNKYLESIPNGPAARDAEIQIGEIYYNKTAQYELAIQHYRKWLKAHPSDSESPEFLMRIGRAQFFLWQFEEAIKTFRIVAEQFPTSTVRSEATFQIGMCHLSLASLSRGGESGEDEEDATPVVDAKAHHRSATLAFESVLKIAPGTKHAQEAALGLVTVLEEQGLWEEALKKLNEMKGSYPSPQVLKIREHRIQERMSRRITRTRR